MPDPQPLADDLVQAAWLYHIGQMSQEEVSRRMGLSRFKVLRLLAEAREAGLVRITLEHRTSATLALADRLARHYRLTEVQVAPPAGEGPEAARRAVGQLAARFLSRIGSAGEVTIGVGWGRTLAAMAGSLAGLHNPQLRFVSLMGAMARTSATSPFDVCARLADLTGGSAMFLPAPFLVDSVADAAVILRQRLVRETLAVARSATYMIVSLGECTPGALLQSSGVLTVAEIEALELAGAVADSSGKFFRADGSLADVDLNLRAPSVSLEDMQRSDVVLLAAGAAKADAVRAVLAAGFCNRLLLDEPLARLLDAGG